MLSVVTTSRNDDHGHRPVERTQRHIDCLYQQANEYRQEVEYILVEWNPPKDKPPITEAVDFHSDTPYWHPRIIPVSDDLHFTYPNSGRIPLFQMIAKNVGIRRSHGEFILATNIDILLSDEMFVFITSTIPGKGAYYRTDRFDADADVPVENRKDMLDYCSSHILRQCGRSSIAVFDEPEAIKDVKLKGNPPLIPHPIYINTHHQLNRAYNQVYRGYHWAKRQAAISLLKYPDVHTMACGDFQLLHRDEWFAMRGYPEIPVFSIHIDSLFMLQAYYSGIREVVMPYPIYHIEHAFGTSLVPGGDAVMYKNLTEKGVPYLPLVCILDAAREMGHGGYRNGKFRKINGYWTWRENTDTWGLADHNLTEAKV